MAEKPQQQSTKERILGLLRKGYTRNQLITDFNFAERTVDAAIKEYKELHGDDPGETKGDSEKGDREPQAPSKRNSGLMVRKESETVLPEWVAAQLDLFDGSEREKRIFMSGIAVPLMGLRLFAEAAEPIIGLLSVWQKGQAEAARAAQQSGIEIAQQAAQQTLSGTMPQILGMVREQAVARSPNPMATMMVNAIQPYFQQLVANMMGAMMRGPGQHPAGAQLGPPIQPPGQGAPFGPQEATQDEVKEAFDE